MQATRPREAYARVPAVGIGRVAMPQGRRPERCEITTGTKVGKPRRVTPSSHLPRDAWARPRRPNGSPGAIGRCDRRPPPMRPDPHLDEAPARRRINSVHSATRTRLLAGWESTAPCGTITLIGSASAENQPARVDIIRAVLAACGSERAGCRRRYRPGRALHGSSAERLALHARARPRRATGPLRQAPRPALLS